MLARPDYLYLRSRSNRSYAELLRELNLQPSKKSGARAYQAQRKTVRSVQRLPLPPYKDATWFKDEYLRWLSKFFAPVIKVNLMGPKISFSLFIHKAVMLGLTTNIERSTPDRQLLYITGGLLASKENKGRLEFSVVLKRKFVLAAIHDFKPALPWFPYKYTQAFIHLMVMRTFARHLKEQC